MTWENPKCFSAWVLHWRHLLQQHSSAVDALRVFRDNCRLEVAVDVISGMAIEYVGVDFHVKLDDSRSNRSGDIRAAHFVTDDDASRRTVNVDVSCPLNGLNPYVSFLGIGSAKCWPTFTAACWLIVDNCLTSGKSEMRSSLRDFPVHLRKTPTRRRV